MRQVHAVSAEIEESWSEESNEKAAFFNMFISLSDLLSSSVLKTGNDRAKAEHYKELSDLSRISQQFSRLCLAVTSAMSSDTGTTGTSQTDSQKFGLSTITKWRLNLMRNIKVL